MKISEASIEKYEKILISNEFSVIPGVYGVKRNNKLQIHKSISKGTRNFQRLDSRNSIFKSFIYFVSTCFLDETRSGIKNLLQEARSVVL